MLPRIAVVSAGQARGAKALLERAELLYSVGMRMLLVREPNLALPEQRVLAKQLEAQCPELMVVHHLKCPGTRELAGRAAINVHLPASQLGGAAETDAAHIGFSVHSEAELEQAKRQGASYAMLAPIWSPNSKPGDLRPTLGPKIYEVLLKAVELPLFALGGVNADRCAPWRGHPQARVALIGRLFGPDAKVAKDDFSRLQEVMGP